MTSIGNLFEHFMNLVNLKFFTKAECDERYIKKEGINVVLSEDGLLHFIFGDVEFVLTVGRTVYKIGEAVLFSVIFYDDEDEPLKNVNLIFRDVDNDEVIGSGVTNGSGIAIFEYQVNESGSLKVRCENGSLVSNTVSLTFEE